MTLALALTLPAWAQAYEDFNLMPNLSSFETRVMVDGVYRTEGAQPIIVEGAEAVLPLRTVLEGAGYMVSWDAESRTVLADGPGGTEYSMEADTGKLFCDGTLVYTDEAAGIRGGSMYISPGATEYMMGFTVDWDRATNTAVVITDNPGDNLYLYDLGEGTLENPSGRDTTYRMQGVIGVPEGENCPVVVILHGSHPIERASENRYDLGFSYLVDALADAGYLAVSMNVGINYSFEDGEPSGNVRTVQIVEQQIRQLQRAFAGEETGFPCDLTAKGDLNRVILMGHSRGGCDVFTVAEEVEEISVSGILSLAPAKTIPVEEGVPNVPVGILVPQYDGDVMMLDGATIYEEIRNNAVENAEILYLEGGDHGGFSTALVAPDPFGNREDQEKIMSNQRQQAFLEAYALEFVASVLETGKTPLACRDTVPDTLYGERIVARVYDGSTVVFQGRKDSTDPFRGEGAALEPVYTSYMPDGTAGTFNPPGSFLEYGLLQVTWEQPGASVTVPLGDIPDGARSLRIDLAQDSSNAVNGSRDLSMKATLRDQDGGSASVTFGPGTGALRHQAGTIRCYDNYDGTKTCFYSTFTPLGSIKVDLDALEGVDPTGKLELTLSFEASAGSVMIREIAFES